MRLPRRRRGRGPSLEELDIDFDRWRLLSPYHTLGKVESWVFGLDPNGRKCVASHGVAGLHHGRGNLVGSTSFDREAECLRP